MKSTNKEEKSKKKRGRPKRNKSNSKLEKTKHPKNLNQKQNEENNKKEVFRRTNEEIRLNLSAKEALKFREEQKQKEMMEELFKGKKNSKDIQTP